jgi:methionyl aminopeptidase
MIKLKTEKEIAILREGGKHLAFILNSLGKMVVPGVSTQDLENEARRLISEGGDTSPFLNYQPWGATRPFPAALCVSINEEVVHGIPNENPKIIKEGDIVNLDCGLIHEGLYTDSGITVGCGLIDDDALLLIKATKEALEAGIAAISVKGHVGDIGHAISAIADKYNFSIAEDLCGHGVGYSQHEDPFVPNIAKKGQGPVLKPGLVIAIEPMFNEGTGEVVLLKDGYTYVTKDGGRSAQFEHTVAITENGVEILTQL